MRAKQKLSEFKIIYEKPYIEMTYEQQNNIKNLGKNSNNRFFKK